MRHLVNYLKDRLVVPPFVHVNYEVFADTIIQDIRTGRNPSDVLFDTMVVVHDASYDQGASSPWGYLMDRVEDNMQDFVSTLEKEFIRMNDQASVDRIRRYIVEEYNPMMTMMQGRRLIRLINQEEDTNR